MEKTIIYSRSYYLSAAECNAEQELALPQLVQKLIDVATEHANHLGIGNPDMPAPDMGWVLSRLTVEMTSYPRENSDYRIETWVEDWNRHFSLRAFAISDTEGNVYGYARSVWMVLNTKDRSNAGLSGLDFKREWISGRECPIPKQEKHVRIEPDEDSALYRFKYCDIDFYRHVNTVSYVRLILNRFSLEEMDANRAVRLELSFLHEGKYDEPVTLRRQREADGANTFLLRDAKGETPILYARVKLEPRD